VIFATLGNHAVIVLRTPGEHKPAKASIVTWNF